LKPTFNNSSAIAIRSNFRSTRHPFLTNLTRERDRDDYCNNPNFGIQMKIQKLIQKLELTRGPHLSISHHIFSLLRTAHGMAGGVLPKPCVAVEERCRVARPSKVVKSFTPFFPSSSPASLSSAPSVLPFILPWSPWTEREQACCLQLNPRVPLHRFQIHRTQSSTTSLTPCPPPPILATTPTSPGIGVFLAAGLSCARDPPHRRTLTSGHRFSCLTAQIDST